MIVKSRKPSFEALVATAGDMGQWEKLSDEGGASSLIWTQETLVSLILSWPVFDVLFHL